MCRVFGCVAAEPVSIRHELLEAENPLIRQSEDHDSGWGMAVYERADGAEPRAGPLPRGRAHRRRVRGRHRARAAGSSTCTSGAPRWAGSRSRTRTRSASGNYTLCHNGTILALPAPARAGRAAPGGRHRLGAPLQPPDARLRRRRPRRAACARPCGARSSARPSAGSTSSSRDGERLYAYQLGMFELHWLRRPGQLLVASERVTDEPAGTACQQDVLLDARPERPRGAPRGAPAG